MNLPSTAFDNGPDFSVVLLLIMTPIDSSLNSAHFSPSMPAFEGGVRGLRGEWRF